MQKRAHFLTAGAAALTLVALVACGPAATPTPAAKTGGTTATTPSAGSAVTTRAAGAASPSAALTGTPGAGTAGTPMAGATGAATGTPMAGTTGATGAATGTPMTGATGAATGTPMAGTTGAATGTPMTGTTGTGTMATGTPATTGTTGAATGTPMAGTSGAMATGTPMAGTTGAMATGTPMAGTTGTGAMAGLPQIRIMQSISLQNPTPLAIDMSGWKLRIGSQTVSLPSNSRVGPNEVVTIHFGEGTSKDNDIFLGSQSQQMTTALRPGARVMLENPQGQTVTEFALPA